MHGREMQLCFTSCSSFINVDYFKNTIQNLHTYFCLNNILNISQIQTSLETNINTVTKLQESF